MYKVQCQIRNHISTNWKIYNLNFFSWKDSSFFYQLENLQFFLSNEWDAQKRKFMDMWNLLNWISLKANMETCSIITEVFLNKQQTTWFYVKVIWIFQGQHS